MLWEIDLWYLRFDPFKSVPNFHHLLRGFPHLAHEIASILTLPGTHPGHAYTSRQIRAPSDVVSTSDDFGQVL
jgi:hypothetical protein